MTEASGNTITERRFEEFSPGRIIITIRNALRYLSSKWLLLLLLGTAFGLTYIAINYSQKTKYTATLSFALDDGAAKSTTSSSFSALSEELGFSPTYEAGGVFSSLTNIIELLQSKLLIEKTLKQSVTFNNKAILFADFFLDSLEYREKWMSGSPYEKINFVNSKASKEEEIFRNGIVNNIYAVITSKLLKIDKKGKGSTLIQVMLTSENEAFSRYFLEALVEEVSKFYVEIKTHRSKLHLEFIQKRTDSIRNAFGGSLYSKAAFTDANINVAREVAVVPNERRQTDVQVLRETYINLVKSSEAAKTSLMEDTPLFQYLDTPVFPLEKTSGSLLKGFLLFFIIGIILSGIFFLVRKFYRHIISNEEPESAEEEYATY